MILALYLLNRELPALKLLPQLFFVLLDEDVGLRGAQSKGNKIEPKQHNEMQMQMTFNLLLELGFFPAAMLRTKE